MSDEREYWRSVVVGRVNEQQPIYAGELLDELVDLRAQLAERDRRIGELEAELRRWRGCPSCKEDHDDNVMCPPHEVRTSGRAWFHTQARKWAERAEELQVERDELQRKLDACQCETRVLNESLLIEARQERDQARAERDNLRVMFNDSQIVLRSASRRADEATSARRQAEKERNELKRKLVACQCETRVLNESMLIEVERERDQLAAEVEQLREALEMIATIKLNESDPAFIGICPMRIGFLRPVHMSKVKEALAATPHAAKAVERVRKLENAVQAARELTVNFESRTYRAPHHGDGWEAIKHEVQLREQLRKALDRLDALDKPEGNNGSV